MKPENVNCGLCGKSMGMGDPRANHYHIACMEKDMAEIRKNMPPSRHNPTVKCPKYLEPKHRCKIDKEDGILRIPAQTRVVR